MTGRHPSCEECPPVWTMKDDDPVRGGCANCRFLWAADNVMANLLIDERFKKVRKEKAR